MHAKPREDVPRRMTAEKMRVLIEKIVCGDVAEIRLTLVVPGSVICTVCIQIPSTRVSIGGLGVPIMEF